MSIIKVSAKLDRTDGNTPWGFRMAGGKDYSSPLVIQRVNPGSLSSKCGIQTGDAITHIRGIDVTPLAHKEAQDLIIHSGNSLELKLERSSHGHFTSDHQPQEHHQQPSLLPWQQQQQAPPHQYNKSATTAFNFAPRPFQKSGAVTTITTHTANLNLGGHSTPQDPGVESLNNNIPDPVSVTPDINWLVFPSPDLVNEARTNSKGDDEVAKNRTDGNGVNEENSGNNDINIRARAGVKVQRSSSMTGTGRSSGGGDDDDGRIFARRNSQAQAQSRSFKRLQNLLEENNNEDKGNSSSSSSSQSSVPPPISSKPQISLKPKIPSVKPKLSPMPYKTSSLDTNSRPIQSEYLSGSADPPVLSNPVKGTHTLTSNLPSYSHKPPPPSDSCPIGANPPTRPKPALKQCNNPIGLYSKQTVSDVGLTSQSEGPVTTPLLATVIVKETSAGGDVILDGSTQRKTITISKNKVQSHSPVSTPGIGESIVQSNGRKQIIVKSKSTVKDEIVSRETGENVVSLPRLEAHVKSDDVIYGLEKPKIIIKTKSSEHSGNPIGSDSINDFTLEDLGLSDAVVVSISLPSSMKECIPSAAVEVMESRSQIKVIKKAAEKQVINPPASNHSYGNPPRTFGAGPPTAPKASQQAPGAWRPQIPTGERKVKVGRPGQAQRVPAMVGSSRIPICTACHTSIRGPFISALDKTWCPDHFICANPNCAQFLFDCGFVEEADQLYCEKDYEKYLAPRCAKCSAAIVGEVVNAMKNTYHMHCFLCVACHQPIGTGSFHNEDGKIYCEKDWGTLFQTKCYGCQFPIEPGDRWLEALSQNWHSECFNCSTCQVTLEGQSFCAKNGKPYCKKHGGTRHI